MADILQPLPIALNTPIISSARRYLTKAASSRPTAPSLDESDLLKSIRIALGGSRGDSDVAVHTLLYRTAEDGAGDEELHWDAHTVVLSSGGVMRKRYSFEQEGEPVQWACIGYLQQSGSGPSPSSSRSSKYTSDNQYKPITRDPNERPTFGPFYSAQREPKQEREPETVSRALFVFLRSIGKVYLFNDVEHTFYLPFIVRKAWPLQPHGVLIQRALEATEISEAEDEDETLLPTIFSFTNPFSEPTTVGLAERIVGGFHSVPASLSRSDPDKPISVLDAQEYVLYVLQRASDLSDQVVVTLNRATKRVSIWRYSLIASSEASSAKDLPRPARNKRASMAGGMPLHRRQSSASSDTARIPSQLTDIALPGVLPSLATASTMAALAGGGSTDLPVPTHGRKRESMSKIDLSINMDRIGLDVRGPLDPAAAVRQTPVYWMQRLCSYDVSEADTTVLTNISAELFDQRWDGSSNRSLVAVCLPATDRLLIFRVTKEKDHTLSAVYEKCLSGKSIVSVRATRDTVRDLLVLRRDASLTILTHGIREVPLRYTHGNTASQLPRPSSAPSSASSPLVVAMKDALDLAVTLVLKDTTEYRVSLNMMPTDGTTRQCFLMLAQALPNDAFFELHCRFLVRWALQDYSTDDALQFEAFKSVLCEVFELERLPVWKSDTSNPWTKLASSSSIGRFHEDPVLQNLRVPKRLYSPTSSLDPRKKPHKLLAPLLYALHFVAEDMRCTIYRHQALMDLVPLICHIAVLIRPEWADYWKRLCPEAIAVWPSPSDTVVSHLVEGLPYWPPDLGFLMLGRMSNPDYSIPWPDKQKFVELEEDPPSYAYGRTEPLMRLHKLSVVYQCLSDTRVDTRKRAEAALHMMVKSQIGPEVLRYLPLGLAAPLREAARSCQLAPSGDWPLAAFQIIGRNDLAEGVLQNPETANNQAYRPNKDSLTPSPLRKTIQGQVEQAVKLSTGEISAASGMELELKDFTAIRFGQDKRLEEVARMLDSSSIPTVKAIDRPDMSEHDQAKEHVNQVVRLAERTLALPVGRAPFTFASIPEVTKESYAIPKLEFSVRLQPHNTLISPEQGKIPTECISWGDFHNGVAAGLRISPQAQSVDSTWIKFNKPDDLTPEHAGFLYALGLTGHLREMLTWHTFGYLTPKHDMTSIGVLLGLSAANAGTGNSHVTKLIAVHTPALLPTQAVDLNVPLITQAAGLMGIGLLYMGTKNRRMAEVCLSEISRRDLYQPDLSNEYREAYTLSAGLACGMVMLGKGSSIPADLHIVDRLRALIHGEGHVPGVGGTRRPNFDVNLTSPTATIALGLMYLRTERQDVADILAIPDTIVALNAIQPNFLLTRTLARSLIMWNAVAPTTEWLTGQMPQNIATAIGARFEGKRIDDAYEMAYFNIIAGGCFAIALKYAGTAREEAYLLIIKYYDHLSQLLYTNSPSYDNRIKKAAIRDGLNLISISLNMVMAGTGEINCLRRLRYAYGMSNPQIRYGSHVATHISLGLLFLGGGRYTLGTSDAAIACMVAAFFPRFAQISSDNKSYLQPLRHLWVLAVEPRCLITRDVDTKEVVYLPVKIKVREGKEVGTSQLISPTLIPDINKVISIRVDTPRYWPFYLDIQSYPRHRESLLRSQTLYVKRRTAFLSYMEDPKGSRSLFVRSGSSSGNAAMLDFPKLSDAKAHPASDLHQFISSFSNDSLFLAFADRFCRDDGETDQEHLLRAYCHAALLDSILQDKAQTIQAHLTLFRYRTMTPRSRYFNLRAYDLHFATEFYTRIYGRALSGRAENNPRPSLLRESTLVGALHAQAERLREMRETPAFLQVLGYYARGERVPDFPSDTPEHAAVAYLPWYLMFNCVPPAPALLTMRELAHEAHEQCLRAPPPQGTTNATLLDLGIKEVLMSTGLQLATGGGGTWNVQSLDEIVAAWGSAA